MNLKQKLVSGIGIVALGLSLTGGIATAAQYDSDSADAQLNVICPSTATIEVNVDGAFEVDASQGLSSYDATLPGGFSMEMDLTCNWSWAFTVNAKIGTFHHQGPTHAGMADQFSGSHLLLNNGGLDDYTGPTASASSNVWGLSAGAPDVQSQVFHGMATVDWGVITNDGGLIFFRQASPGVTTASWDGNLKNLPPNLDEGTYVAPLTVELIVI